MTDKLAKIYICNIDKYKYKSYESVTVKAQAITKWKENKLVWASKRLHIILYYFPRVW